jgi:hypothetical protein
MANAVGNALASFGAMPNACRSRPPASGTWVRPNNPLGVRNNRALRQPNAPNLFYAHGKIRMPADGRIRKSVRPGNSAPSGPAPPHARKPKKRGWNGPFAAGPRVRVSVPPGRVRCEPDFGVRHRASSGRVLNWPARDAFVGR